MQPSGADADAGPDRACICIHVLLFIRFALPRVSLPRISTHFLVLFRKWIVVPDPECPRSALPPLDHPSKGKKSILGFSCTLLWTICHPTCVTEKSSSRASCHDMSRHMLLRPVAQLFPPVFCPRQSLPPFQSSIDHHACSLNFYAADS